MAEHVYVQNISTKIVKATSPAATAMVVDTNIYAALDIMGGVLTFANALRPPAGTGILQSITITDDDNEKAPFDLLFFRASPTVTVADNGPWTHDAAGVANFLGRVQVLAADYLTAVAGSLAGASIKNIGLPVVATDGSTIFALALATGTPTFTATSDVQIFAGFCRD